MKKNVLLTLTSLFILALMPMNGYGQGFLKKLKQKVEKAVGMEEPAAESNLQKAAEEGNTPQGTPTATDRLPKLRIPTSSWDEMIQPSKASSVRALLNELPALPSINELAVPTAEARESYYRKIVAVDLRVEELDKMNTCSDEEILAAREKIYQELADVIGLTVEEMKQLENPNLSETERERLSEKARNAIIDNADMGRITSMADKLEKMEKDKGRKLTDEEMMQFAADNPEMMQDMMSIAGKTMESTAKINAANAKFTKLNQQTVEVSEKLAQLRKKNLNAITSCEEIAQDYENDLKNIYGQVFATEDRTKIDLLYAEADKLMKNYRTQAAKLWRNSLQVQLDEVKAILPEIENLYKEMAKEEMIPACAVNRAPYNLVTSYTDILHDAYSDFPQPKVLPVQTEVILELKKHESLLQAESGFASSVDDFVTNSRLLVYDEQANGYFIYENGKRREVTGKIPNQLQPRTTRTQPPYNTWTSKSGKRKVTYARDGSVTLQDGTSFYPLAFKAETDKLVWIIMENKGILKCTYKL